ncbi:MAG: hypothetical protein KA059_03525 [Elusimicrobiales bacterium]|jgi:hypothetical protein|nr:hypothetical protein [Elusimicrobiales bacterium]NLH38447.1 hypothetical protein [Elusimicrobiota bacterium]
MSEFDFKTEMHLIKLLGIKARNIEELYENIRIVPLSSIYYHTHRFLKQHHFLSPEPPNDFAYWIKNALNIKKLAEAVSSIDTVSFDGLKELRNAILATIYNYLKNVKTINNCERGEEFYFMSCQTFVFSTGKKANNINEFYEIMKDIDINSIYFHIFESRLRLKKKENDFQNWFNEIGEARIAMKLSNFDPYTMTLDNLRKKILSIIEDTLK